MPGLTSSPGWWLEDEIQQSGNPAQHAHDAVVRMKENGIGWAVLNAAVGGASMALGQLRVAGTNLGHGAFGYWAQNAEPQTLLGMARSDGVAVCIANVESRAEEQKWTDGDLNELVRICPNYHAGVAYTEAAWGKYPADHPDAAKRGQYRADLAKRWVDRGIVSMPEADMVRNQAATINAMTAVSLAFGWAQDHTSCLLYLDGKPASTYTPQAAATLGRWSIWRYGNMDTANYAEIAKWPRPAPEPTPEPPPPPPPELPKMTVTEAHGNTRYGVQAVRNNGVTLGRAASLTLQDRLALASLSGKHTAANGQQIANLLDNLGYPQV